MSLEAQKFNVAGEVKFVAGTTYSSGEVIKLSDGRAAVIGGLAGFVSGDQAVAYTDGIFKLAAASATTIAVGADVWWDASENQAINRAASPDDADFFVGVATVAKTNGQTTVTVDLNAGGTLAKKAGSTTTPVTVTTANMRWIEQIIKNTATSGDNRLAYLRMYLGGAGGSGDCLRAFTSVDDVVAANAHGVHGSVNFGAADEDGAVTGQATGVRGTCHVPNKTVSQGTHSGGISEIYHDGASSSIAGVAHAIHRFINGGNSTGMATLDNVFSFEGMNADSVKTGTVGGTAKGLRVLIDGAVHYLTLGTSCS